LPPAYIYDHFVINQEASALDHDNEVFQDSEINTSEDRFLAPRHFCGQINKDADAWLKQFANYCAYREIAAPKKLALFKVLTVGNAALWLESLSDEVKSD